jgi:hypothetical protein
MGIIKGKREESEQETARTKQAAIYICGVGKDAVDRVDTPTIDDQLEECRSAANALYADIICEFIDEWTDTSLLPTGMQHLADLIEMEPSLDYVLVYSPGPELWEAVNDIALSGKGTLVVSVEGEHEISWAYGVPHA